MRPYPCSPNLRKRILPVRPAQLRQRSLWPWHRVAPHPPRITPLPRRRPDRPLLRKCPQRLHEDIVLPMPPPQPRQPYQNDLRHLRKRYCLNTVSTHVGSTSTNAYPPSQLSPTTSGTTGVQPATPSPAPPASLRSAPTLPPTDIRCTSRASSSALRPRSSIFKITIFAIGAGSSS